MTMIKKIILIVVMTAAATICGCKTAVDADCKECKEATATSTSNPQLTPQTPWWVY